VECPIYKYFRKQYKQELFFLSTLQIYFCHHAHKKEEQKLNMPFVNAKQTRMKSRTDVLSCHTSYKCCQHFINIADCRHTTYNTRSTIVLTSHSTAVHYSCQVSLIEDMRSYIMFQVVVNTTNKHVSKEAW